MGDSYPRQKAGLILLLIVSPLLLIGLASGYLKADSATLTLTFFAGIGMGMMSGNTRTQRVRGYGVKR